MKTLRTHVGSGLRPDKKTIKADAVKIPKFVSIFMGPTPETSLNQLQLFQLHPVRANMGKVVLCLLH